MGDRSDQLAQHAAVITEPLTPAQWTTARVPQLPENNKEIEGLNGALAATQKLIDHQFQKTELLAIALSPRYLGRAAVEEHRRMAWLGDVVLNIAIADLYLGHFNPFDRDQYHNVHGKFAPNASLASWGESVGLIELLYFPNKHGPEKLPLRTVATAVEALMGAVYLDAGLDHAARWLGHWAATNGVIESYQGLYRPNTVDLTQEQLRKVNLNGELRRHFDLLESRLQTMVVSNGSGRYIGQALLVERMVGKRVLEFVASEQIFCESPVQSLKASVDRRSFELKAARMKPVARWSGAPKVDIFRGNRNLAEGTRAGASRVQSVQWAVGNTYMEQGFCGARHFASQILEKAKELDNAAGSQVASDQL